MSHFQNIAFQSGLRNAQSEQQRHPQQQGMSRSLANMPIYPDEEQPAQQLSSFKSTTTAKPRNFSSDLLQQALAAKSNLGLCDGLARSDALQSLRSYGSQSLQDSPGKNPRYQDPGIPLGGYQGAASGMGQPVQYQSANSGVGQPVQKPRYQGANPGVLGQSVQSPRYQDSPSMMSGQNSRYLRPALTASQGEARREQRDQEEWYKSLQEDVSFANDQKGTGDSKEGSLTSFQPPTHLNTVEDEDEFLYGGSTPMTETRGETPRQEEVATVKEGTGNWSDEDIMIIEDSSNVKLPRASLEPPQPKSNREATAIPLKDLSWKSSTAWKDESLYNQKAGKPKTVDLPRPTYQGSSRLESRVTEAAAVALEKVPSVSLAQQSEKMTTQEKKSKYANAAALLKKQLNVNMMSNSPSLETREQMADHTLLEKSMKSAPAEGPSKGGSPYSHLLVDIEKASSVPQKRGDSLTENSLRSSKFKNSSPLTVQHNKDTISKPETSSARVNALESTRHRESPKVNIPRYLDEYMKPKPDKYSKESYERKNLSGERPPHSPLRISPSGYRYRSPSLEKRRDRSRSPEYRSRHRSRPRIPDERSRERSPRYRNRSRGRSPPRHYEDRPRRDKSCDRRMAAKRQHSPDSPRRPSKKEMPERQKPVPPSVEETLSLERPPSSRLFPKSMSPDMAALFMKEHELPKEPVRPKIPEKQVDPVVESADQDLVIQKLNFTIRQLQQAECLNQLVAEMQEEDEAKQVNILAQKVELALDANTRRYEAQQAAAAAYPPANAFTQPPSDMSYPHQGMYLPTAPIHQAPQYPYGYPASSPAPPYPAPSYPYAQPYPPSTMYSQLPSAPATSVYSQGSSSAYSQVAAPPPPAPKLANAAPPPPSRWLRSVPVLTDEEMSKEGRAAENEPELMLQYCRRVEERNLSHKKLTNLSNQVTEIQKMREDFQKRSKKMRSGNDGHFISEIQVLQERASAELKREINELKRLNDEVQDLESRIHPSSLIQCKENMTRQAQEEKKPTKIYSGFDTGTHFCVQCSTKFTSIMDMVQHLHTEEKLQHESTVSVALKEPPKVEVKANALQPVKGVEFVKPVNAFYCSLCEETLLNPLFVEQHLKGHDHIVKYLNYLQENPIYEAKRKLMENARAKAAAKENRLKELEEISKAQQILKKKKQDSEKRREDMEVQLQKVHQQLQGERLRNREVMELGDENDDEEEGPPTLASKKKAAIKVNLAEKEARRAEGKDKEPPPKKPRQQVIYIGRAPNFKPKEKVVRKEPEKWVKGRKVQERRGKEEQEKDKEAKEQEKVLSRSQDESNKQYGPALPPKTPISKTVSPIEERHKEVEPAVGKGGGSHSDQGHSKKEDVLAVKKKSEAPQKVFGCQSEAEAKSVQGDRKQEAEGKTSQKKEATTVQLQMNEPKTDNPAVTQALKNILYGSKSKPPGKDTDLSVIKLPENPPSPPSSAKVIVKPKPQAKKPLTEEEKDFILLGINKSDMEPIAIPKPPPSSLLKARSSSPVKTTKASISPSNVTVTFSPQIASPKEKVSSPKITVPSPNLQVPLPNLQVPPPNLQVPPPSLHVPPPTLQIPPPTLQVPPPTLHVPPPTLHVPPPNLQVPPPNILSNSPVRHAPYGQAFTLPVRFHSPGYTQPQYNYIGEVVDMDLDYDDGTGFVHVGTPLPKAMPYSNQRSGYSKPTEASPDKTKPKTEVLQTSNSDHDDSKTIVTKQNTFDNNPKTTTVTGVGLKEDKLICESVLNYVITNVVEKHLENSLNLNTETSNVNEPAVIHKSTGIKSPKGLQSSQLDLVSRSVSTDSTVCDKLQVHTDKTSNIVSTGTEEVVEGVGTLTSLSVTNVETFDVISKEKDFQVTKEVSMDSSELVFSSTSENMNTEDSNTIESKNHQESEPPKNLTICDGKDSNGISNQEDLTSLTEQIYVQEADQLDITGTTEVNSSQLDINKKENNAFGIKELTSEENVNSVITSEENLVIFEQNIISSDEVVKTPNDIAILENKSDEASKTLDDIAILENKPDVVPKTPDDIAILENKTGEIPKTVDGISILENKTELDSSVQHVNFIEYEDISETPLIHGIEHFMDSKEDNPPHETSINSEESLKNLTSKQETVMLLEDENVSEPSTSIVVENEQKSHIEEVENSSLKLCVSDIETMDVEQTDILLPSTEDVGTSNSQSFKQESVMPWKDENCGELSTSIAEGNEQKSPTEVSSLKLCVSGTEKMDVEKTDFSTEDDDIQIVFETTMNSQCPRDERIKVEEIVLIPKTEEVDAETVTTDKLGNPQELNCEKNSLESCISGIRSFDETHQNSPSYLGKDSSKEYSLEENSEQKEILGTCNTESGLVPDEQVKAIQCPIDIELLANECKIENAIGKENTFKLPLCQVRSLAEKMHSTEEVEHLEDRTVHQVHTEEQENVENINKPVTDISGNSKQAKNQTIENSEDLGTSDLSSETVPPPGIEVTAHASEDMKITDESIIEDSDSKDNSGINSSVPSLDKFDLDDSLSNSLSDNPPILSEEPIPENVCQLTTEKKQDSDTDEYETEDGK